MTAHAKPAYLYARYSSAHQKDGSSIERQMEYGRRFIEQQGWQLVEELKDEGKSAFKGANRVEGAALFEFERQAREGHFANGAVLVCENVDRLSRQGAKATARLIWALNEAGVDVATYHDGHIYKAGEDADLMDLFSAIIKGALGKEESAKKSARSKAWWEKTYKAITNGTSKAHSKQVPAWIDIEDGTFVLNEHRADIVRQMYAWYCDGQGSLQILYKLREMQERPWSKESRYKDRAEWTVRYIHKVLTARQAVGEYVTIKGETIATDFYPAVVDLATFNKAQDIRAKRRRSGGDALKRSQNLFATILKCGQCGKSATLTTKMTVKRGLTHYIRCNEARYSHIQCTNNTAIRYDILEKTVLEGMLPDLAADRLEDTKTDAYENAIAELQRQKAAREKQSENIVDAITDGQAPKVLMDRLTAIQADIEEINSQMTAARDAWSREATKPKRSTEAAIIADLMSRIESDDPTTRFEARMSVNAALTRLLNRVDIEPTGTFRIWTSETDWFLFDKTGTMLEAEQVWTGVDSQTQKELREAAE